MQVPMAYYDNIDLSGAIISDQVFNLNSIFDPDRTGVGHQPLGHDQWQTFYNRYRVDSVDVELTWVNGSGTQAADILALASNDSSAINTLARFQAAAESSFCRSSMLSYYSSNNVERWKMKYYLNQITGVTRAKYQSDDLYAADMGSSPTEVIVLHLASKDFAYLAAIATKVRVKLTYFVTMFDRFQLTIS